MRAGNIMYMDITLLPMYDYVARFPFPNKHNTQRIYEYPSKPQIPKGDLSCHWGSECPRKRPQMLIMMEPLSRILGMDHPKARNTSYGSTEHMSTHQNISLTAHRRQESRRNPDKYRPTDLRQRPDH